MKKIAAVAVSIGVILVIIGLVLVGIYGRDKITSGEWFAFGATDLTSAKGGIDKQPDELEGITEINVKVSAYSVYVLKSATDVASVKYVDPLEDGVNIDIVYNNGVLSVTQTDNLSHKFWGFNWLGNRRFIVIYLPQTEQFTQAELTIKADYSAVKINEVNFKSVDVTTEAGSIRIDDLKADSIKVKASAGSIRLDEIIAQSVTVNSEAGSIRIDDVKAEQVSLESKAGSINAEEVDCVTLNAKADAGSVRVLDVKALTSVEIEVGAGSVRCEVETVSLVIKSGAGSIRFNTNASSIKLTSNTGSVRGTINGNKSEYQIDVRKGVGSSNISNQIVQGATKNLSVDVETGSIKIDFDND